MSRLPTFHAPTARPHVIAHGRGGDIIIGAAYVPPTRVEVDDDCARLQRAFLQQRLRRPVPLDAYVAQRLAQFRAESPIAAGERGLPRDVVALVIVALVVVASAVFGVIS